MVVSGRRAFVTRQAPNLSFKMEVEPGEWFDALSHYSFAAQELAMISPRSAALRGRGFSTRSVEGQAEEMRFENPRSLSHTETPHRRGSALRRNRPVWERGWQATSSGVPATTICPPPSPPSGPRSITQSASAIKSKLCSMTITEWPASTRRWSTSTSRRTSALCRPMVGSSRRKRLEVGRRRSEERRGVEAPWTASAIGWSLPSPRWLTSDSCLLTSGLCPLISVLNPLNR